MELNFSVTSVGTQCISHKIHTFERQTAMPEPNSS